jgi:hypothetical protein
MIADRPPLIRSWLWAAAAVLAAGTILATLELAPRVWFAILPYLEPHVMAWYLCAGALAALALFASSWAAGPVHRAPALLALLAMVAVYVTLLFVYYAGEPPAKKFHLLEYGALACIALQAVSVDTAHRRGLFLAAVFLFVVGTADETAQGFSPTRTFRWLDLFGNYVAVCLGSLAWSACSPHSPWRRR